MSIEETRRHYDDFAPRYEDFFRARQSDKILKLGAYLSRPFAPHRLDAGSGTGLVGRVLRRPFICVDASPKMLALAEGRRVIADMTRLPFRDETFGLVVSVSAIEKSVSGYATICELLRVLKPGGQLGVTALKSADVLGVQEALRERPELDVRRIDLEADLGFVVRKP